jgi:hypothetical protein
MALARIISRSHQCSRELALDLLARGYAVEIVSPDAIPDNLADLELRLEADNQNELAASVAAHGGGHQASLDFVHHLRAPMGDFLRRPPQTSPTISYPVQPVSFNAEPGITGDVGLPSENWRAPEPARSEPESMSGVEESARLIRPPEQLPTPRKEEAKSNRRDLVNELASNVRRGWNLSRRGFESLVVRLRDFDRKQTKLAGTREWFRRTGLTIAAVLAEERFRRARLKTAAALSEARFWRIGLRIAVVVLMAIVLGRGIRRSGTPFAGPASQLQPAKVQAAPSPASFPAVPEPQQAAAPSARPASAGNSEADSAQASTKPSTPVVNSGKSRAVRSRSKDDLVARDTVTYYHRSATVPVKDSRHRSSSRK